MQEIWRDIEGFVGHYKVSNKGRVKSLCGTPKILSQKTSNCGYKQAHLSKNNKAKRYSVHRLVGKAFVDNPRNKPQINHKNGDKTDNRAENLEWCTASENQLHAFSTGLAPRTSEKKKQHINRQRRLVGRPVINLDTKLSYSSANFAEKMTGISNASISQNCRGISKTAGGYRWEFLYGSQKFPFKQ